MGPKSIRDSTDEWADWGYGLGAGFGAGSASNLVRIGINRYQSRAR